MGSSRRDLQPFFDYRQCCLHIGVDGAEVTKGARRIDGQSSARSLLQHPRTPGSLLVSGVVGYAVTVDPGDLGTGIDGEVARGEVEVTDLHGDLGRVTQEAPNPQPYHSASAHQSHRARSVRSISTFSCR